MDKDEIMSAIYNKNKAEIDQCIKDTHEISRDLYKSSGMSKQGNMQFKGRVPMVIYTKMVQLYGPDCWNDEKWVDSFFRAYNRFKVGNRP